MVAPVARVKGCSSSPSLISNFFTNSVAPSMENLVSLLAFSILSFFNQVPQLYWKNWFLCGSFASLILVNTSLGSSERNLLATLEMGEFLTQGLSRTALLEPILAAFLNIVCERVRDMGILGVALNANFAPKMSILTVYRGATKSTVK